MDNARLVKRALLHLALLAGLAPWLGCTTWQGGIQGFLQNRVKDTLGAIDLGLTTTHTPQHSLYVGGLSIAPFGYGRIDGDLTGLAGADFGRMPVHQHNWGLLLFGREEMGIGDGGLWHFGGYDVNDPDTMDIRGVGIVSLLQDYFMRQEGRPGAFLGTVVSLHVGYVGLLVDVYPVKLVDALLGWIGFDLSGDDGYKFGRWPWQTARRMLRLNTGIEGASIAYGKPAPPKQKPPGQAPKPIDFVAPQPKAEEPPPKTPVYVARPPESVTPPPANLPPRITFVDPRGDVTTEEERFKLVVIVTDPDSRIRDVSLSMGRTARNLAVVPIEHSTRPTERPAKGDERIIERLVDLAEGSNLVEVIACDEQDSRASRVITITRMPRAAATPTPPPVAEPARKGKSFAVVIGIGDYENKDIPRLRYPAADAKSIYEFLVSPAGGFKKENVRLLLDKEATQRAIRSELGTVLARKAALKEDMVFIFFAGHGAPEVDLAKKDPDGYAKYIVAHDSDRKDLFATAIPMDEVRTYFERFEAKTVVFVADACYSGASGGRTFAPPGTRVPQITGNFLERMAGEGRVIITASDVNEPALEIDALGHGIFTHYFLEGLRGAADANRDKEITLQEIYDYVYERVARHSRDAGGNQHPIWRGSGKGKIPMARLE